LWLSGNTRDKLVQSFSFYFPRLPEQPEILEAVNIDEVEQRARKVLRWLSMDGNSRWLIILDNIDQYAPVDSATDDAYDIRKFFPGSDHGSILITSRLPGLSELGKSIPINKLDPKDAIQLLKSKSGLPSGTDESLQASLGTSMCEI
jgi:hypothetical protein